MNYWYLSGRKEEKIVRKEELTYRLVNGFFSIFPENLSTKNYSYNIYK